MSQNQQMIWIVAAVAIVAILLMLFLSIGGGEQACADSITGCSGYAIAN